MIYLFIAAIAFAGCGDEQEPGDMYGIDTDNVIFLDAVVASNYDKCLTDAEQVAMGTYEYASPEDMNANGMGGGSEIAGPVSRLMIAMDVSGSMAAEAGSQTKMNHATEAVNEFVETLGDRVQVGLLAFGHKGDNDEAGKAESCAGVEVLFPMAMPNKDDISSKLMNLKPTGWTPLAAAIEMSAQQMNGEGIRGEQVIWILSDGKETCGGNPIQMAEKYFNGPEKIIINVIGLDLPAEERSELEEVTRAGGGMFIELNSQSEPDFKSNIRDILLSGSVHQEVRQPMLSDMIYTNQDMALAGIQECVLMTLDKEMQALEMSVATATDEEAIKEARELMKERYEMANTLLNEYITELMEGDTEELKEILEEMKTILVIKRV